VKAHLSSTSSSDVSRLSKPGSASGTVAGLFRRCPHFRGKARLQQWLVRRSGVERVTVFGYKMSLDLADVIQRDVYSGLYEPFESRWLKQFLRPGMTFVDVGANIGYYTWLASRRVGPTGRVVAIEPGPYAFELLQRVIRENRVRNVEGYQFALSDREGHGTLYVPAVEEGNYNPSLSPYLPGMSAVEIRIDRLDDVLDRLQVGRVDLIKIDVEGHELGVLQGAARAIEEHRIAAVLCEFNVGYQACAGSSCEDLERCLTDRGFVLSRRFPSKWGSRVHNRLYVAREARATHPIDRRPRK
jgi:FkbM family methyltransferase